MISPEMQPLLTEAAQKADTPILILQSILGNDAVVRELITDRPGKASILEQAKQQVNSLDPQEKVIFLEKTFAILSDPDPQYQDKRDAALGILTIMDLTSVSPERLKTTYVESVFNLWEHINQDSDPYGEIHALLEAGKTIAPFIKKSTSITQAWTRVAKAFEKDDRQKILGDIEEIRQLIPTAYSKFDTKVLMLVGRGLRTQEIAIKLDVKIKDVQLSKCRLREKGVRFRSFNKPERKPDKVH